MTYLNKTTWNDIKGNENAKENIENNYINTILYPNIFLNKSKGILLYGPPGTGKTLLAKATAHRLKDISNFFIVSGSDIKSNIPGRSEKNLKSLFKTAQEYTEQDNNKKYSIIFFDEFDSIARHRNSGYTNVAIVNQLLQLMDGFSSHDNVSIIAATNYPWNIDDAILSRFSTKTLCDFPNAEVMTQYHYQFNKK